MKAGLPPLWAAVLAAVALVGGSVAVSVAWGVRHLIWGIVIALVLLVVVITEGSFRMVRGARKAHSDELRAVRQDLEDAQQAQRRVDADWSAERSRREAAELASPEDQDRPPLVVTILEDSKFSNWRHMAMIAALHVEVENTTDAPIDVQGYGYTFDTEGASLWSHEASSEDRLAIEREMHRRDQAQEYGQPLRIYGRIPARSRVSGWVLLAVNRKPQGGTPECTVIVTDDVGNEYRAKLPKREPQIYGP